LDSKVSCKCTCTWLVDEKDNAGASGRHPGEREDGVASRIEEAVRLSPTGKANCDLYPEYLVHSILRPKITLQRRTQRRQPFCVGTEWEGKKASSFSATQNAAEREREERPTLHRGGADGGRWRRGCRRGVRIRPAAIGGSRGRRPGAPAKADPDEVAASGSAPSARLYGSPASDSHPRRRRGEACSSGVVCTCAQIRRGRWSRGLEALRLGRRGTAGGAPAFSSLDPAGRLLPRRPCLLFPGSGRLLQCIRWRRRGGLAGLGWRQRGGLAGGRAWAWCCLVTKGGPSARDQAGAGAAPPARSAESCFGFVVGERGI